MLVVTSSVGMVDGVHADTGNAGESFALSFVFVEKGSAFHDGLLVPASSGDDADGGSAAAVDGLPGTGRESDSGLVSLLGVADDGGVGAGASGVGSLVANSGFDVADGGSLGDLTDGEDVSGGDGGLATSEDVLSGVGALSCQEVFGLFLVLIGILEVHLDKGTSTSWIVEHSSDNTSHVALSL